MDTEAMEAGFQNAIEVALEMISTWAISVLGAMALLIVGRIAAGIEAGGCNIPFPQQDVHVIEFPGRTG